MIYNEKEKPRNQKVCFERGRGVRDNQVGQLVGRGFKNKKIVYTVGQTTSGRRFEIKDESELNRTAFRSTRSRRERTINEAPPH